MPTFIRHVLLTLTQPRTMRTILPILFACTLLSGCASYALRGTVVDGRDRAVAISEPSILVVPADDPRLQTDGLASAAVSVTLDPEALRPINAGTTTTDSFGRFELPIEHGAGMLLYDAYVLAQRPGHQSADAFMPLPKKNQRLLIVLPKGEDTWQRPTDFVEETLEMGKPYMEGGQ
jgi:hypothetical protein